MGKKVKGGRFKKGNAKKKEEKIERTKVREMGKKAKKRKIKEKGKNPSEERGKRKCRGRGKGGRRYDMNRTDNEGMNEEEEEEKEGMEEVKREGTGGKGEWRAAKQERERQMQRHSLLCLQDRTEGQPKISAVKIRATDQQNLFLFQPLSLPFLFSFSILNDNHNHYLSSSSSLIPHFPNRYHLEIFDFS